MFAAKDGFWFQYPNNAVVPDKELWSWGTSEYGENGLFHNYNYLSPKQVGQDSNWAAIYPSSTSSINSVFAKRIDGTLWTWGRNYAGLLGHGNAFTYSDDRLYLFNSSSPTQVGKLVNWDTVSAGFGHAIATKTDGTLWGWGDNRYGQLGLGNTTYCSSPTQIGSLTNWARASAGSRFTIAIKTNGTLWAWGYNGAGQLGLNNQLNISSPVQVGALTNWSFVELGSDCTFAIKTDGTLWAWGYNGYYGLLGLGTSSSYYSSPVQVGLLTNWKSISTGDYFATAVKTDGTLWAWGSGWHGTLGLGNVTSYSSPKQIGVLTNWLSANSNGLTTIATKTDGTLWGWGSSFYGQISSTLSNAFKGWNDPTIVNPDVYSPVQIGIDTDWVNGVPIGESSVAAIKQNGSIWTWGDNQEGQLGLDNCSNYANVTQGRYSSPTQVGELTNWATISIGQYNSSAIKKDGTLWTWGMNIYGGLGNGISGNSTYYISPVQVGALTDWLTVSTTYHTIALKADKTMWAWGLNRYGELGTYNLSYYSSPVQVGTSKWLQVAAGYYHSAGIKQNGTLWTWGWNRYGQLGQGTGGWDTDTSSPMQVGALSNWSFVAPGLDMTFAIKKDGTLWAWGDNWRGQLGLGNTTYYSSPVQVGALTTWATISFVFEHALAVRTDGTLWAWGNNGSGQLGLGNVISYSSPVQVGTMTDWLKVATNQDFSLAIKKDGTMWSWGEGRWGETGQSELIMRSSPVQVGVGRYWSDISAGNMVALALKTLPVQGVGLWSCGGKGNAEIGQHVNNDDPTPSIVMPYDTDNSWKAVSGTYNWTVGIKTDGTLWEWGRTRTPFFTDPVTAWVPPPPKYSKPHQIGTDNTWKSVAINNGRTDFNRYAFAIKTNGTLWAWGLNQYGVLGLGDTVERTSPVQVGTLTNWASVSGRLAIKTDGTLWGISTNFIVDTSSPVQIGALTNWAKVSHNSSALLLKTNGTLWAMGNNHEGQLGVGDTINRNSPVQVGALTDWVDIYSSNRTSYGIRANGTLWAWGFNSNGQIGDGTFNYANVSPIQVGTGTTWLRLGAGGYNVTAIKADGSAWAWGDNTYGIAGHISDPIQIYGGSEHYLNSPVQVGSAWGTRLWDIYQSIPTVISGNGDATFLITANGQLWSWGKNNFGQLGKGTETLKGWETHYSSPGQIGNTTDWLSVSAGAYFYTGIRTDNSLWAWGEDSFGSLPLGPDVWGSISSPTQVGFDKWLASTSGWFHGLAIKDNSTLWAWGVNYSGQLGLGDSTIRYDITQVGAKKDWAKISAGTFHSLAIKKNGTLWVWGDNGSGQLGLNDRTIRWSPVQVGSLTTWLSVAGGFYTSAAIKTDGTLWTWGDNRYGQLGLGNTTYYSSPKQVGLDSNWASISIGFYYSLAVKTDGTLWAWGYNRDGQLGLGNTTYYSNPIQVGVLTNWAKVTTGVRHAAAVKTDGTMWSWGDNSVGQLGINNFTNYSSPKQVGYYKNWTGVEAGNFSLIGLRNTIPGTLWGLGINPSGETGTNIPGQIDQTDVLVPTQSQIIQDWKYIVGSNRDGPNGTHAAALTTDGKLWVWGANDYGQSGLPPVPYFHIRYPMLVDNTSTWAVISVGAINKVGIKSDGTLWAWGGNPAGQLGQNDTVTRSSPTQIGIGTDWLSVTASGYNMKAVKKNGTLWSWGANWAGQLGLGNTNYYSSPKQVGALTNWKSVSGQFAIKKDGTLWTWGYNGNGQLGVGDSLNISSPVQVGVGTDWLKLSSGHYHTIAIKTNGTLWATGANGDGQLGTGNTISTTSFVQIGTETTWQDISTDDRSSSAIKENGTLWYWGKSYIGAYHTNSSMVYRVSSPVQLGTSTDWYKVAGAGSTMLLLSKKSAS